MTASAAPPRDRTAPRPSPATPAPTAPATNFLRHVVEQDLARGAYAARLGVPHRATGPGNHAVDRAVVADPARVRTRFPPEPNGYLHIGHAKSICLNFGLARDYDGVCHLRFDDTNPEKEDVEYVDAIIEMVRWLGFDWDAKPFEREAADASGAAGGPDAVEDHLYFASEYFELLYEFAEYLIRTGHAYVDSQTPDAMRAMRGTLVEPGRDSPYRTRGVDENLALFRMMRAGDFPDGAHVLRARIDMASPNINLRDPVLYRIRHAHHHRTGDAWRIYPMYDYTHCVSDALENITHSVCTLEFEDHRPLYDWALERIVPVLRAPQFMHAVDRVRALRDGDGRGFAMRCKGFVGKLFASPEEARMRALFARWDGVAAPGEIASRDLDEFFDLLLDHPEQFAPLLTHALDASDGRHGGTPNPMGLPHQYEFSRLNLTYVVTSKRKLKQLVDEGHVDGWDDPRMPTLVGLRRRGYTPASIRLLAERVGVSKSNSWTDYAELDQALRDDLDPKAARAFAILDPIRLVVTNYPADATETCTAPVHPHAPERGQRRFPFARELLIERDDFQEEPQKGFFRLSPPAAGRPGSTVRLKYGYVVRCTGFRKDADGRVDEVACEYLPDTFSGTPGADAIKVKGNIAWISAAHAEAAEFRLYDRLFVDAQPDAGGRDFLASLNPDSKRVVHGYVEPGVAGDAASSWQFERLGYFVADRVDSTAARPVLNRVATLRDTWQR